MWDVQRDMGVVRWQQIRGLTLARKMMVVMMMMMMMMVMVMMTVSRQHNGMINLKKKENKATNGAALRDI